MIGRAGRGHIKQTVRLFAFFFVLFDAVKIVTAGRSFAMARRQSDQRSKFSGERDATAGAVRSPIQIGHDDHGEFEPLGLMNRHQPDDIRRLGLRRRQGFAGLLRDELREFNHKVVEREEAGAVHCAGLIHNLMHIREFSIAQIFAKQNRIVRRDPQHLAQQFCNRHAVLDAAQMCERVGRKRYARSLLLVEFRWKCFGKQARGQSLLMSRQPEQRRVLECEHRATQYACQGDVVRQTREYLEQIREVEDFLLRIECMAADKVIVDSAARQRLFVTLHIGERAKQNRDVTLPYRTRSVFVIVNDELLLVVEHLPNPPGDPLGLATPGSRRRAGRTWRTLVLHPQKLDRRRLRCGRSMCMQRFIRLAKPVAEHRIHKIEHRRLATEIERKRHLASFGDFVLQLLEHTGIGTTKTIDRLFEVADEKQLAAGYVVAAQRFDECYLNAVGVLKLVDQYQRKLGGDTFP